MSEEQDYPSLIDQGKNLAKFSWDLIKYIQTNQNGILFVTDEVYKERMTICKGCDKYDELENRCKECGCYVPGKAKIILDSCPLDKWKSDQSSWDEKFENIVSDIQENNP
jgi:hypothetical protein